MALLLAGRFASGIGFGDVRRLARPYHQPVSVAPNLTPEPTVGALPGRLLALVVRPTARPLRWGVVVAVAFIAGEALLVLQLKRIAPENTFGAVFLLGVLVVSAG